MRRKHRIPRLSSLLILAALGCDKEPPAQKQPAAAPEAAGPASPADSLVLPLPNGTEVWYTLAREERDATGTSCVERTLEIRTPTAKIPVPLLYTRDVPRLVNDSTVSARIWNRCVPGDEYRINLRTGQPVRASR
jgi:hypothetical protein